MEITYLFYKCHTIKSKCLFPSNLRIFGEIALSYQTSNGQVYESQYWDLTYTTVNANNHNWAHITNLEYYTVCQGYWPL